MKTRNLLPLILILVGFQSNVQCQKLSHKIQKSTEEIGETFTEIPLDRLQTLDQIAYSIYRGNNTIYFLDHENSTKSILAMIWLRTGLMYYGHSADFAVKSAGIQHSFEKLPDLSLLAKEGFEIELNQKQNEVFYKIKYGSDDWQIDLKSFNKSSIDGKNSLLVYLEEDIEEITPFKGLSFTMHQLEDIPREMLYLATRLDNLQKTKTK